MELSESSSMVLKNAKKIFGDLLAWSVEFLWNYLLFDLICLCDFFEEELSADFNTKLCSRSIPDC